jgi:hypothetical protein
MRGIRGNIVVGAVALCALGGPALAAAPAQAGIVVYPPEATTSFGGTGSGEGTFEGPGATAVNEETGDVYVMDVGGESGARPNKVEKFNAEGKYISQFSIEPAIPSYYYYRGAIAVDNGTGPAKGDVYVGSGGAIDVYGPEGESLSQISTPTGAPVLAVAVDPAGNVWANDSHGYFYEFSDTGSLLQKFEDGEEEGGPGLAVDSNDNVYWSYARRGFKFDAMGQLDGEFALSNEAGLVTAIAFNSFVTKNDVLIVRKKMLEEYGPFAEPFERPVRVFGTSGLEEAHGMAVDSATGVVYVTEAITNKVDVFKPIIVEPPVVNDRPPTVTGITRTTAQLAGTVNPENNSTSYHFQYVAADEYEPAATEPYENAASTPLGAVAAGSLDEAVGPYALTGLLAGTTYHYRLAACNEAGCSYGQDETFTTAPATPPGVTTGPAIEVTQTTATLTGIVEAQALQTSYEFEFGSSTSYGGKQFGNAGRSGGEEPVSVVLQFLVPGLTYHFRLVATNEDGTTYGQDVAFTTPGILALISQPPAQALVPSPVVAFPSVAGAITKPQGSGKSKKKRKTKTKPRKHKTKAKGKQRGRKG